MSITRDRKKTTVLSSNASSFPLKMTLSSLNVTVSSSTLYQKIVKEFSELSSVEATAGYGVLKFNGKEYKDKGLFIGYNLGLNSGMLKFTGVESSDVFEEFRVKYMMGSTNLENLEHITISLFNGYFAVPLSENLQDQEQFSNLVTKVVAAQKLKQPKVSVENGELIVGSKSTGNYIRVVAPSMYTSAKTKVGIYVKLSRTATSNLLQLIATNEDVSITEIFAYQTLLLISKTTQTSLSNDIRTTLLSENNVSSIISTTRSSKEPLSASGKVVSRALKTVSNKLTKEHKTETIKLVIQWLDTLSKEITQQGEKELYTEVEKFIANKSGKKGNDSGQGSGTGGKK